MAEIFDLSDLNPGAWFDFGNGGRVCIRTCSSDDLAEIARQSETKQIEYKVNEKTRQMERIPFSKVDDDLQKSLYWDYIIVDWGNLVDQDGKDIPCTKANKILFMGKSSKFARFVLSCLEKLTEDETKQKEDERKN